jgi:N6-adenosine-specific RNA methylase IME4
MRMDAPERVLCGEGTNGRYRTIVADPPWAYPEGFALGHGHGDLEVRPLAYPSLTVEEIAELPVADLAERDCRLFLWTTNRYLPDAFGVVNAWGFRYRQILVWHKTDANLPSHIAPNSAEFILVGTQGKPARLGTLPSAVIPRVRHGAGGGGLFAPIKAHSQKPECWLDHFEQVSPGPYLELFARRQRLGWDTWGDEAIEHVSLTTALGQRGSK